MSDIQKVIARNAAKEDVGTALKQPNGHFLYTIKGSGQIVQALRWRDMLAALEQAHLDYQVLRVNDHEMHCDADVRAQVLAKHFQGRFLDEDDR